MESAASPCEKTTPSLRYSSLVRPRPAVARSRFASNEGLLTFLAMIQFPFPRLNLSGQNISIGQSNGPKVTQEFRDGTHAEGFDYARYWSSVELKTVAFLSR